MRRLVVTRRRCARPLVNAVPRNTSSPCLLQAVRAADKGGRDGRRKSQSEVQYLFSISEGSVFVLVEYYPWERKEVGKAGREFSGFIEGETKISQGDANNNNRATKGVETCNCLGKKRVISRGKKKIIREINSKP